MYSYKIEVDSTPQIRVHKIIFDSAYKVQDEVLNRPLISVVTAVACGRLNGFRFRSPLLTQSKFDKFAKLTKAKKPNARECEIFAFKYASAGRNGKHKNRQVF